MLKKALKLLLWCGGLLLLAVLCWLAAIFWVWPMWGALALFLGIVGGVAGAIWLRRQLYAYRVRRKMAQQNPAGSTGPSPMWQTWKEGLATLRHSGLSKLGHPNYVLPWYVVLGEQSSGKTTALTRTRLNAPIQDVNQARMVPPTDGLAWWFLDQSVVIDTTGRFLRGEGAERKDWDKLVRLMTKARSEEPVNGIIVTVAADRLMEGEADAQVEQGRALRSRIDELMTGFGAQLPVYVLVTKCDLLYGLDEWSRLLPEADHLQAMGYINPQPTASPAGFLQDAFHSVSERLKDIRLELMLQTPQVTPGLLMFPHEFEQLKPGLERWFSGAFSDSPYLETPMLRGLYFSSGQRLGDVPSRTLKEFGLAEQTMRVKFTGKGLFLQELFAKILPADRHLYRPLDQMLRWQRHSRSVGLAAWLCLMAAVGVLLTGSFVKSFNTVDELRERYPGKPVLTGRFGADLESMNKYYALIKWMQDRDHHWLIKLVPFNDQVVSLENQLKSKFSNDFQRFILISLDTRLENRTKDLLQRDPNQSITKYIQLIVRRVNLLQGRLDGKDHYELSKAPTAIYSTSLVAIIKDIDGEDITPETAQNFGDLYVAYVAWQQSTDSLLTERRELKKWLNRIAMNSANLSWLSEWANFQYNLKPVTLDQFWQGSGQVPHQVVVPAAYTKEGKKHIDSFIAELRGTVEDPAYVLEKKSLDAKLDVFARWYDQERRLAWLTLLSNFDQGRGLLANEIEWRMALERAAEERGPHDLVISRVVEELDEGPEKPVPEWLALARRVDNAKSIAHAQGLLKSAKRAAGIVDKLGRDILVTSVVDGPTQGKNIFVGQSSGATAYADYLKQLRAAIKQVRDGQGHATQLAADFYAFKRDPAIKASPLHSAATSLQTMQKVLTQPGENSQMVWAQVAGPMRMLIDYSGQQAGCTLQKEWEAKVMFPLNSATSVTEVEDSLFGSQGTVWAFADTTAKSFLQRGANQYTLAESLGQKPPIKDTLLSFIGYGLERNRAKKLGTLTEKHQALEGKLQTQQQQKTLKTLNADLVDLQAKIDALRQKAHTVSVTNVPTSANPDAKAKPFSTFLLVQCASGAHKLENLNFSASTTFDWSQKQCGDTTLSIKVDNLTLVTKYAGEAGFVEFLKAFQDGAHTFKPEDFSAAERKRLEALQVKQIVVRYKFSGHEALLDAVEQQQRLEQKLAQARAEKAALEGSQEQDVERKDRQELAALEDQIAGVESGKPYRLQIPGKIAACWDDPLPRVESRATPPAATPGVQPARSATGSYYVQLGLFGEADLPPHQERLSKAGYQVHLVPMNAQVGSRLRLRVGPYDTPAQAQKALQELKQGYPYRPFVLKAPAAAVPGSSGAPAKPPAAKKPVVRTPVLQPPTTPAQAEPGPTQPVG